MSVDREEHVGDRPGSPGCIPPGTPGVAIIQPLPGRPGLELPAEQAFVERAPLVASATPSSKKLTVPVMLFMVAKLRRAPPFFDELTVRRRP